MKLTFEQVENFREIAKKEKLMDWEILWDYPSEVIIANANGIGSEAMGPFLRGALDILYPDFIIPSVIHDMEWSFQPDSDSTAYFLETNYRFRENCIKMAKRNHCILSFRRYILMRRANNFEFILNNFGRTAFDTAKNDNHH